MTARTDLSYEQTIGHLHGLVGSRVMASARPTVEPLSTVAVAGVLTFGLEADLSNFAEAWPELADETLLFRIGPPHIGPDGTGGFFTVSRGSFLGAELTTSDVGSAKLTITMRGAMSLDVEPARDFGL